MPACPGPVLGAVRELAWLVGHLALYPTGLFTQGPAREPAREAPSGAGRTTTPVVLVHGLADNRSVFAVLRRALHRQGFSDIHPFDHNPLGGDIRGKAELLDHHIARVCERTGAPDVHVVGHSLGGLVARYHAQRIDRGAHVRTVVTLGTPHRGTLAAHLLRAHPLVRELCPDSTVVAELALPAPDCTTRFLAYWGDLDPFVIPLTSGTIDHPDLDAANIRVSGAGHLTLPACRSIVRDLCTLLTGMHNADPREAPDAAPDATSAPLAA
ncbi:MAG: alpha/beta fold hydrolase [Streptomycetaceae bacterium]|jgi:hypothetical protein|nr:alpha/beta fold hydrolase [Streptomycetaceae bacterium]